MRPAAIFLGTLALIGMPVGLKAAPARVDRLPLHAKLPALAGLHGLSVGQSRVDFPGRAHRLAKLALHRRDLSVQSGQSSLPAPRGDAQVAWAQAVAAAGAGAGGQAPNANPPASPAPSGMISADNVMLDIGKIRLVIKHIYLDGTSLSKADLDAIFDVHSSVSAAKRLARLTAAHVAISQMLIEPKPAAGAQGQPSGKAAAPPTEGLMLRDIVMDNLVQGRAGLVIVGAARAKMFASSPDTTELRLGLVRFTNLDLVHLARLLSPGTPGASTRPLCDSLSIDGASISFPKSKLTLAIQTLTIKKLAIGSGSQAPQGGPLLPHNLPGAQTAKPAYPFADVSLGSLAFTSLQLASTDDRPWKAGIASGYFGHVSGARIGNMDLESISFSGRTVVASIGHFGWQGLNLMLPLGYFLLAGPPQIEKVPGWPHAGQPQPSTGGKLPSSGAQKITADSIDITLTPAALGPPPIKIPTRFQLAHFVFATSAPVQGVATRLVAALDHFTCDLKNVNASNPEFAQLGYSKLDLSSRLEAHLAHNNTQFGLDLLSLRGAGMGSVAVAGSFAHLTKAMSSPASPDREKALRKMRVDHMEIRVENKGLFERIIAARAKTTNTSPAAVRKALINSVTTSMSKALDKFGETDLITAALVKFINAPKTFRLSVVAPQGIGLDDFSAHKSPATLLDKIEIEVTADE